MSFVPRVTPERFLPLISLLVVTAFCAWVYWPGITGPSLLDDASSVGVLSSISDNPEYAHDFVFRDGSGPLGRSVSVATFALEEYLYDGNVAIRKANNILLHLLTGALVACFFLLLVHFQPAPGARAAAVLAAAVWMLAPLYVSTVLYIVQRMAMLATLFSVATLIAYLKWRISLLEGRNNLIWLLLVPVFLLLAVFSKENALVTVPILLCLEAFWCQFRGPEGVHSRLRSAVLGLIAAGLVFALALLTFRWERMAGKFWNRDFTLTERLMTQLRIVWDYVGQFFFPELQRMGLYHDDVLVSTSLTSPTTTMYALAAWLLLAVAIAALSVRPSGRMLAFGAVFFLIGHSIESTIWPLELYFEHRNYLPGIGLALLPLCGFVLLARRWPATANPLLAWMSVWLVWLLTLTSSQVQVWSKPELLATQHVIAHPESARANSEYATLLAEVGALDSALAYSRKAHEVALRHKASADESLGDMHARNIALSCLAGGELPSDMLAEIGVANPSRPMGSASTMSVIVRLRQGDVCPLFDWDALSDHLAGLYLREFDTRQASAGMFSALASLANAQARYDEAYEYTRRHLALAPGSITGQLMQLHFTTLLGMEGEAGRLRDHLLSLSESGKLTRLERDNLAFYLGN